VEPILLLDKPQGATPLETVRAFARAHPSYQNVALGYAGRLDPMAEGLLLVLVGAENKKRKEYEQLEKTYTLRVLFGFETDSFDLLGLVTSVADPQKITQQFAVETLENIPHRFVQHYPPYSAKPVDGKPLYYWAREGKLHEHTIPQKEVQLFQKIIIDMTHISKRTLHSEIKERIGKIHGNFRQKTILSCWDQILADCPHTSFPLATISITCTSGTYMRSLAHQLGQRMGVSALAFEIIRTSVGPYTRDQAIRVTL
jgi:tRNA pseudouridine55 synthase